MAFSGLFTLSPYPVGERDQWEGLCAKQQHNHTGILENSSSEEDFKTEGLNHLGVEIQPGDYDLDEGNSVKHAVRRKRDVKV